MVIDDELLRQDMNDLTVHWEGHDPCSFDHLVNFPRGDFLIFHRQEPGAIDAHDMPTGNANIDRPNVDPRHYLGILHGLANGLDRAVDVHHHALLEATGRMGADPNHVDHTITFDFPNDGADLGRPDVKTCHNMLPPAAHGMPSSRVSLRV